VKGNAEDDSDSCALSLQPFKAPVAVLAEVGPDETPRADVFDLLNIVPYIRKFKTSECG
jgi:peptidyl-prolyl cis-trans isomerase-like protein 2